MFRVLVSTLDPTRPQVTGDTLRLAEPYRASTERNGRIAGARALADAAHARVSSARRPPDPQVQLGVGTDLNELERIGTEIEHSLRGVRGTRSVFAEREVSGYYLDIDIARAAAARHGLNVGNVQTVIATAIGGRPITQTVEGRQRYAVRVRYRQELRDTPERLAGVLVPVSHGLGTRPVLGRDMNGMTWISTTIYRQAGLVDGSVAGSVIRTRNGACVEW